jgi:hypothetical protein
MNKELKKFLKEIKKNVKPPQVDFEKHKPTDNELNNLTYLSMKYIIGWPMRLTDFAVVKMMGGEVASVKGLDEKFIPEMANYMWDHLMGEPDDLKVDDLISAIQAVRDMLFGMDEKTRNSI